MLEIGELLKRGYELMNRGCPIECLAFKDLSIAHNINAVYIYEPIRGGKQLIINTKGKYLEATSAVSFEQLLNAFTTSKILKSVLTREEGLINYFNEIIFTIENKKDPSWEDWVRKLGNELILKKFSHRGSLQFILSSLQNLNASNIETLLLENNINLPVAPKTRNALLEIFEQKLKKIDAIFEEHQKRREKW